MSIYYLLGSSEGPWFESPMCKFYIGLTLVMDFTYPICYYIIWRQESAKALGKTNKTK